MFKIQKEEYVNKTFRIPLDLLKELEYLAQKENVSLNKLVVQCCQYALDNITTNNDDVPQQ
jgi:predicted HicB family RNase H-like nuclease